MPWTLDQVPKEQNTNVEVAEGLTIDLKMRVFVVNRSASANKPCMVQ